MQCKQATDADVTCMSLACFVQVFSQQCGSGVQNNAKAASSLGDSSSNVLKTADQDEDILF